MNQQNETSRPLGVAHLIFGLIFLGIAATWLIGEANHTDVPDLAIGFPAVLIGAGIIGLAASVLNQRRAKARILATTYEPDTYNSTETEAPLEETTILTTDLSTDKDES